mmetsp:Transcript_26008/g.71632  ORF Transcript_26008/g.71632 Transcript_26008/m.71632 type:complete len:218 (+) Transcript_26008:65-718(+)
MIMIMILSALALVLGFAATTTTAFAPTLHSTAISNTRLYAEQQGTIDTSFMWGAGLNFGKGEFKFYRNLQDFLKPFPDQDRQAFPEVFTLPCGTYEVQLDKPLGIVFEEVEVGKGLFVQDLVEGGNAEQEGQVQKGDLLVGITAVKIVGAKYERRLIPCRNFDFDTMVGAVSSNEPKWGCEDVVLMFERPDEADSAQVDQFMAFFEPPVDSPWRMQQ